ncbi:uncharacterized protein [Miscanthus floridulus]|uniref:uncharacterized protein n=1 Tax=Miscanthus floridulus TaxID=154761 RepID=UPI003459DF1F
MGVGAAGSGAGSPPSWGRRLAAEGCTSTGATMSVAAHSAPVASVSGCCSCGGGHGNCVNIYVNNNVQGVTNSVLVGSKVVMQDPGPRVSSGHHQPRRDGRRRRRREGKRNRHQQLQHMAKTIKIGIVAVVVSSLLFVAAAAGTILLLESLVCTSQ